jgi:membrane protease YdiL (CAAX protease family)
MSRVRISSYKRLGNQMSVQNSPVRNKLYFIALPFFLYLTLGVIFTIMVRWFGKEVGYLLSFAFYWLIFGLAIPVLLIGRDIFFSILKDRIPLFGRYNFIAALLWLIITGVTLVMYGSKFVAAPLSLILVAIPLAAINGFCEEIFWRGVFVKTFPGNPWLGIVYPAVGFAIWHLIPQSVFPADNVFGFILSTFFLGLAYGFIAYKTGSAKWTAISHSLNGILALSGMLAPSIMRIFYK